MRLSSCGCLQGDVDDEIRELHSRVRKLIRVALAIEIEGKFQNELPTQLESTMRKAQAIKRLNKNVIQR